MSDTREHYERVMCEAGHRPARWSARDGAPLKVAMADPEDRFAETGNVCEACGQFFPVYLHPDRWPESLKPCTGERHE